jgi:DNA-binding Xre family transcriptional regulator
MNTELAEKANITQQQISKIDAGMNCHLATLLKVCRALNLKIEIKQNFNVTSPC